MTRAARCWRGTRSPADFAEQVAFVDVNVRPRTLTGDRTEFLGRNGSVESPAALDRLELSGRVGAWNWIRVPRCG